MYSGHWLYGGGWLYGGHWLNAGRRFYSAPWLYGAPWLYDGLRLYRYRTSTHKQMDNNANNAQYNELESNQRQFKTI